MLPAKTNGQKFLSIPSPIPSKISNKIFQYFLSEKRGWHKESGSAKETKLGIIQESLTNEVSSGAFQQTFKKMLAQISYL